MCYHKNVLVFLLNKLYEGSCMIIGVLKRIAQTLWGKFESKQELMKFLLLAIIMGLIICVYWSLRPIKDTIFYVIVGGNYIARAKIVSLLVSFPLVIFYSKLIDIFGRQKVFYILTALYSLSMFAFAWAFAHPTIGLLNTVSSWDRYIGWAWYAYVESFGSLIVALFWAIATDVTLPEAAKRGFPLIAFFAQLGNIFGPKMVGTALKSKVFATSAPIVFICGCTVLVVGLLMKLFNTVIPQEDLKGYSSKNPEASKEEAGFLEGLKLLLTHKYLLGMFVIVSTYELIVTIIDNHFKRCTFETYACEAEVGAYLADYGYWTGVVALLCLIFGISNIQRKLGMRVSLFTLPALVSLAVITLWLNPYSLSVLFWIMVASKAVNYAFNQPVLKQLYIPTTEDTKYKAQAWIEAFGSRTSKAGGAAVADWRDSFTTIAQYITMTSLLSFGLIGLWFVIALYIANRFDKAIKENKVVC